MTPAQEGVAVSTHDPFARPTIVEALCELYFGLGEGREWNEEWFGEFFRKVEADFPRMEPRQVMSFKPGQGTGALREVTPVLGMLYRHTSRPLLRQVFQDKLTVNEIEAYPGWRPFRADVKAAWDALTPVIAPAGVRRIGLRYINRIPRAGGTETAGDWLAASDYYPAKLLRQRAGFFSRFEHRPTDGLRLVVTVADEKADSQPMPIIFDIDSILEAELPPDWGALTSELEMLHEAVWEVFASALTDKLRALLQGGAS